MAEKKKIKENKTPEKFSLKYTGDRRIKIDKLMKKYNKLRISDLFDELLLLGELNNDNIYSINSEDKNDPLLIALQEKWNEDKEIMDNLISFMGKVENRLTRIEEFLFTKTQEEKEKFIQTNKKESEIFDKNTEDF